MDETTSAMTCPRNKASHLLRVGTLPWRRRSSTISHHDEHDADNDDAALVVVICLVEPGQQRSREYYWTDLIKMATKKSSGWRVRMAVTLQCGSSERSMNDLLFRKKDGTC